MISRTFFVVLLCQLVLVFPQAQSSGIKSPDEFLPYPLGSRFTPHHLLVDYFRYVDGLSDKMQLVQYGQTNELRPLIAAIISSPANVKRIDAIRQNNLRRTGMLDGSPVDEDIAIVYLSYSVHGNEAAGSESAMAVLYDLIKGGTPYDAWLENTVVIIDPSLNPDGYSRYTQWSNSVSANPNNPRPNTREHSEPWPGGRANHYYFDLNRDWVWQTQQESRDRVAFYLQWMPHIHADLHEMGAESPYYFAPAAQPYHDDITKWQADFQVEIGKNHAAHFDAKGWRYYTGERFDLFYPGFGDTYPTFNGAIGMTYEQGGGGYANLGVLLENGDTLTLYDRIAHHREASLSTIEVASKNASRLITEFEAYFKNSMTDPPGAYNTYIIRASKYPGRVEDILRLLRDHHIIYGMITEERKGLKGFNYQTGEITTFSAIPGDVMIPAAQTRAVLLHVLFEPDSHLADSMSYDITAWCLPMAYGLEAYATESTIEFDFMMPGDRTVPEVIGKPFGYALEWGSMASAEVLTSVLNQGLVVRVAPSPFVIDGKTYGAGTILMLRADNRKDPDFDQKAYYIFTRCREHWGAIYPIPMSIIRTGFADEGKDLGSDAYRLVRQPAVLAFTGDDLAPGNIGEVWYYFEQKIRCPIHLVDKSDMDHVKLDYYTVIILTEGYYAIDDSMLEKLNQWVVRGGRLIVIGSGITKVAGRKGFGIELKSADPQETATPSGSAPEIYSGNERKSLSNDIPGTVFQTTIDPTNPLTFGLGPVYWTLKTSTSSYNWLKDNGNAIYLDDTPKYYGFAGYKALYATKNTLVAGLEYHGAGSVVYLVDNPLFRCFWNSGMVLFSNALFF